MIVLCVFFIGWAHVVCALYIPEVEFANVSTMEPIVLQSVPHERYNKVTRIIPSFRWRTATVFFFICLNGLSYLGPLLCAFRHVTSARTRAGRAKQPLEPVWPATNMAADRPSMSHGETRSHDTSFQRQRNRLFLYIFSQEATLKSWLKYKILFEWIDPPPTHRQTRNFFAVL